MKKRLTILISIFLISIFLIIVLIPNISAALDRGLCVEAEMSEIVPSSVGIDEEFTIGVHIENCGEIIPEDVVFEIIRLPTDISVKEPLLIQIPVIRYANSERFINYHMKTSKEAVSGTYVIETRLSYGGRTKDYYIEITVIGDEAELGIASLKTEPVLPKKGETVELTLRIENIGEGIAKSVEVYMEHPFKGLKQSFIGALDSDEDGPVVLTFVADKAGEFDIPITISYKDDFGTNEILTQINLTILKKEINWILILFIIALVLFAVWGFRNYSKLKRTKNKIIHQLLEGKEGKEDDEEIKTSEIKKETDEEKKKREKKQKRIKEFKEEILKKHKK